MAEPITREAFEAANARGRRAIARGPTAIAARYEKGRIVVELNIDPAVMHLKYKDAPSYRGDGNHRHEKALARSETRAASAGHSIAKGRAHV